MSRSWSDEDLKTALKMNVSILGVLRDLKLSHSPGNYKSIGTRISQLSLDRSHIKGQAHGTSVSPNKLVTEAIMVENSTYSNTDNLRKRLIKEGILENKCKECGLVNVWNEKTITLQLDHINGNPRDHRLENLRILCPNCHSQTPTFRGKNKKGRYTDQCNSCLDCGNPATKNCFRCWVCFKNWSKLNKHYKVNWPEPTELLERIAKSSYAQVAREIGVTDNTVRKHLKRTYGSAPSRWDINRSLSLD
jgi:hypothetical protein